MEKKDGTRKKPADYVKFVLNSGAILEIRGIVQYNQFLKDGSVGTNPALPGVTYIKTRDGTSYHIRDDETAAVMAGDDLPGKDAIGFLSRP